MIQLPRSVPVLLMSLLLAVSASACGGDDAASESSGGGSSSSASASDEGDAGAFDEAAVAKRADSYDEAPSEKLDADGTYSVKMTTTEGAFDIEVLPKAGPIAAANFVFLVKEGYYDGVIFHRVIKDFMIQGGDPTGTGMGGPGYELKDDPVDLPYERGTVAMANAGPNTGGSQFFIVQGAQGEALPPSYVIFGKVDADGMKVVDKIADVELKEDPSSGATSYPASPVRIEKAELVTS